MTRATPCPAAVSGGRAPRFCSVAEAGLRSWLPLLIDATVEAGAGYGERQCAVTFLSDCRHVIVFSACGCRARQGAAVAE